MVTSFIYKIHIMLYIHINPITNKNIDKNGFILFYTQKATAFKFTIEVPLFFHHKHKEDM